MSRHSETFRAAVVLNGAASLKHHASQPTNGAAFLRLRGHVLKLMQDLVDDSKMSLADETIMSVCALAWYEILHGSREHYETHMRGLATMLALRGDVTNPYVLPFTYWMDAYGAAVTKGQRFLGENAPTNAESRSDRYT
jgi:hypothetical protein